MTPDRLVQLSVLEARATTEETQWLLSRVGELEASNVELIARYEAARAPLHARIVELEAAVREIGQYATEVADDANAIRWMAEEALHAAAPSVGETRSIGLPNGYVREEVVKPLTGAELAEKHGFEPVPDWKKDPFVRPMRHDHASIGAGGGDDEGYIHPDVLASQSPELQAEYAQRSSDAKRVWLADYINDTAGVFSSEENAKAYVEWTERNYPRSPGWSVRSAALDDLMEEMWPRPNEASLNTEWASAAAIDASMREEMLLMAGKPSPSNESKLCGGFEPTDDMVPVTCTFYAGHDGKCSWACGDEVPNPGCQKCGMRTSLYQCVACSSASSKPLRCVACFGRGWLPSFNPDDPGERVACPDCPLTHEAQLAPCSFGTPCSHPSCGDTVGVSRDAQGRPWCDRHHEPRTGQAPEPRPLDETVEATKDMNLLDALVHVAIWENDRAVKQALRGERDVDGKLWDTCFRTALGSVLSTHGARPTKATPEVLIPDGAPTEVWLSVNDQSISCFYDVAHAYECAEREGEEVAGPYRIEQRPDKAEPERLGVLRKKLGVARGALYSALGVFDGRLPKGDCTAEDITDALDETKDDGEEWIEADKTWPTPEHAQAAYEAYRRSIEAAFPEDNVVAWTPWNDLEVSEQRCWLVALTHAGAPRSETPKHEPDGASHATPQSGGTPDPKGTE